MWLNGEESAYSGRPGFDPGVGKEGMATYSSILAWRIQWTREPGRLQSVGHTESDMTGATKQQQQTSGWWPF